MRTRAQELNAHREARQAARAQALAGVQALAGGRVRSAAPAQRRSHAYSDEPQPMPEPLTNGGQVAGSGQLLVMSAASASIDPAGAAVTFEAIVARAGFATMAGPGDMWTHPVSGVYIAVYSHEWDDFFLGGTVDLWLDGAFARRFGASSWGTWGGGVVEYYALAGTTGQIMVSHTGGAAETCAANVQIALSDPEPTEGIVTLSSSSSANLAESARPVTVVVDAPPAMQVDDVMIALVFSIEPTITDPAGWTREAINSGAGDHRFVLEWKAVESGDIGSSFSWTVDGGTGETEVMVLIVAIRGLTPAAPISGAEGFDGGSSVTEANPPATPGAGVRAMLAFGASSETLPAAAADHTATDMVRQAFSAGDSSNLHVALSAFISEDPMASAEVLFGTNVFEGGAYLVGLQ